MKLDERLQEVIKHVGLNRSELADKIGVRVYKLQDISRGQTKRIPSDVLTGITREFPEISHSWLLTGEGDMLNNEIDGDVAMGLRERFCNYLDFKGVSPKQAEREAGLSNGAISKMGDNTRRTTVDKISNAFPDLNKIWLLTGEGDMLNSDNESSSSAPMPMNEAVPTLPAGWLNVPVVPVTAQAGYMSGYGDPEYIDELDKLPFPVDRHYKGRYICFEVRGDSMDDASSESILNGDFVLAREIQRHLWQDYKLHFKKWSAFVVVTRSEGVVIKQITDHDVENKTITLHSLNPLFSDYTVSLSDVLEIYNVVQITRKSR